MKPLPELEFLFSLTDFGIKLGLDKTRNLLEKFGNPHLKYPSVLIAGTNGKGSVAKTLANILTSAGYRTGLYTSPHLVRIGERIVYNGKEISEKGLALKIRDLQKIIGVQPYHLYPTFFEALTTIAFSFFAEAGAEIVVCEVGMGGRFDSTNVLPSRLEIITRIGLEHTQFLGKTYEEIASEKAGIIKQGSTVISSSQQSGAMKVIRSRAREKKARLYTCGKDFYVRGRSSAADGQTFDFRAGKTEHLSLKTPLLGRHQIENMALAVRAAMALEEHGFRINKEDLYKGAETVFWPCRFQILQKKPVIIIDGAHNPDGMKTLSCTLAEIFPRKKFCFLTGILKDKDWRQMLNILLLKKNVDEIVFTRPDNERALDPALLADFAKKKTEKVKIIQSSAEALKYLKETGKDWCICGSLYLCGDILGIWK
ncbi:MAG: bifunctional folylpolyglutamate synthase/dihydrofolate synthase [Candidatus Omnitrophica bacterium]|nr:bifunctional folylpolyglutamate synthase/dihydrofolate synthase [Candidatus Omnitrophota bacterium]